MTETDTTAPLRLPTFEFNGQSYTVDFRLREFRHLVLGELPEYVPFESARGRVLLRAYRASQHAIEPKSDSPYDVVVKHHGTISLVRPLTDRAKVWVDKWVSKDGFQPWWPATIVVEHRFLANIIEGMKTDGLAVSDKPSTGEE